MVLGGRCGLPRSATGALEEARLQSVAGAPWDGLLEVFGSGLQLLVAYDEERSSTFDSKYLGTQRG